MNDSIAARPMPDLAIDGLRKSIERGDINKAYANLLSELIATIDADRAQRDEQTRAAYYKGRDYGKRMERDKREKILEGYIERASHWKERAKTAEWQLRATAGKVDLAGGYIKIAFTREQVWEVRSLVIMAFANFGDLKPRSAVLTEIYDRCVTALAAVGGRFHREDVHIGRASFSPNPLRKLVIELSPKDDLKYAIHFNAPFARGFESAAGVTLGARRATLVEIFESGLEIESKLDDVRFHAGHTTAREIRRSDGEGCP